MTSLSDIPSEVTDASGTQQNVAELSHSGLTVVLASGGLDSCTLMALAKQQGANPFALFVDYGQPAARAESKAVTRLTEVLNVPLHKVRYRGSRLTAGEIRGRNAFLLHVALMEFPAAAGVALIAVHAGTEYVDCSSDFIDLMQRSFDFHTGGTVTVAAPFVTWTKHDIYCVAESLKIPVSNTYSCEAGNYPCGTCKSCLDRQMLQSDERFG